MKAIFMICHYRQGNSASKTIENPSENGDNNALRGYEHRSLHPIRFVVPNKFSIAIFFFRVKMTR